MLYSIFIFYKFSQIRRNDSSQSSQLKLTFCLKLDCAAIQDKHHTFKVITELKK